MKNACMRGKASAVDVASKFLSRSRDEIAGSAIEKRITRTRRGENEPRKWSATPKTGRVLTRRKLRATTRFSTERNRANGDKKKRGKERRGGEKRMEFWYIKKNREQRRFRREVFGGARECCGGMYATSGWVAVYRCVKLGKNESTAGRGTAIIPETRYQDVYTYSGYLRDAYGSTGRRCRKCSQCFFGFGVVHVRPLSCTR